MSEPVKSRGMSGKDVITVGIFSAIYFVINFAFMLLGGLHPLLWILMPGFIALFTGMVSTMQFNKANMEASAKRGFTNATDAADYLVNHGVPFRDAHGIVGRLVLLCLDKGISLDELPLSEYKEISPVFEEDIYEAISMKTCVEKRVTLGAPGPSVMEQVIAQNKEYLEKN